MENIEQNTQAANEEVEEVQGTDKDTQKMFTQEEVNGFVQSRLSRMRGQAEKELKAEYEKKMSELQEREMKLLVKEQLSMREMPKELAKIITCTDEEDLKIKLDTLQRIYNVREKEEQPAEDEAAKGFRFGSTGGSGGITHADPVRKAMGLDRKE